MSLPAPAFELTVPDDDMEISSERGITGGHVDDVDDDIDLSYQTQYHDDDQILEDARSDNGYASHTMVLDSNKDDVMANGEISLHVEITEADDGQMLDGEQTFDNELYDAEDLPEERIQTQVDFATHGQTLLPGDNAIAEQDSLVTDTYTMTQSVHANPGSAPVSVHSDQDEVENGEHQHVARDDVHLSSQDANANVHDENGKDHNRIGNGEDVQGNELQAHYDDLQTVQHSWTRNDAEEATHEQLVFDDSTLPPLDEQLPSTPLSAADVDESHVAADDAVGAEKAATNNEEESPETLTEERRNSYGDMPPVIPPITVAYGDDEFALFPPREDHPVREYLLGDEVKITKSIKDLLFELRDIFWNTITDENELHLGIQQLDLYISEDSVYASQVTLSHVVGAYVRLAMNDGNSIIHPLNISLDTSTRLPARLTYLMQAASEGKGLTQLAQFGESEDYEESAVENEVEDVAGIPHGDEQTGLSREHLEDHGEAQVRTYNRFSFVTENVPDGEGDSQGSNRESANPANGLPESNHSDRVNASVTATTAQQSLGGAQAVPASSESSVIDEHIAHVEQLTSAELTQQLATDSSAFEGNMPEAQVTDNVQQLNDEHETTDNQNRALYQDTDFQDDLIDYSEDELVDNDEYDDAQKGLTSGSSTLAGDIQYLNQDSTANGANSLDWLENGAVGGTREQLEYIGQSLDYHPDEIVDGETARITDEAIDAQWEANAANDNIELDAADLSNQTLAAPHDQSTSAQFEYGTAVFVQNDNGAETEGLATIDGPNTEIEEEDADGDEQDQASYKLLKDERQASEQMNNEYQVEEHVQNQDQTARNQPFTEDFDDDDLIDYSNDEAEAAEESNYKDKQAQTTTMAASSPSSAKRNRAQVDDDGWDDISNQDTKRMRS